ncbi:alpha,alpha-trehalose-phosphate synthase (UDP-forming) [Larsenimonas rhizosphaerae]|uniref:alpha,alpha-trehalose-phosphate synthase (UDP-forming) n=1 Tax=Larsenimonas rhizosphaerae TaxID=2944682 RepID=UPI002033A0AB|nr:trehalose-6-phosphate synthase [Larsenimonas rhizosphaerae]MCM2130660.1 trehalose-6-phosphate synthase [Larsenimonas rhizosphaerae]
MSNSEQDSQLIVVSNRVPNPDGGSGNQGGLAVGVMTALQQADGLWLGWNGSIDDDEHARLEHYDFDGVRFATFPLTENDHKTYYTGFSNEMLWPLFHYRPDKVEYSRENLEGYLRVNQRFADHLMPLIKDNTRVWVHDYHLVPLGHYLRETGADAPLGYFLHIPFPPWDVLRILPDYENLLRYLSAYDLIGLQSDVDLKNFKDCMTMALDAVEHDDGMLEVDGRRFRAESYPISIDVQAAQEMAQAGVTSSAGKRLQRSLGDRPLVMGVDRLDYSKGVYKRFQAFERLLEKQEHQRGNVVFIQISPPSRTDVHEYAQLRTTLERVAGHVNGRFADYDWTPLRYLNRGYSREAIMGFLRMSRVGFLTPLRDGMNLVAKEFVAAQDPEDPGVLIISHLAGASWELSKGALVCNPYDIDGVADMLEQALTMSLDERKTRWRTMMDVLENNDIHHWSQNFLDELMDVRLNRSAT